MVIDCLESILSKDFNINILNELKNISGWRISPDEFIPEQGKLSEKFSDSGMLINSYNKSLNIPKNESEEIKYCFLNVSATHILRSVLSNSNFLFSNVVLHRYLWNYYNKSSDGVTHVDASEDNAYSIIYYLHDNDGGTTIGEKFYESISNRAIIFKSNTPHRGVGPTISANRFLLNITFTADSYERKQ
jgi:hypothetical protein